MKISLLLVALCLVISLGSALRMGSKNRPVLINRPTIDTFGPRDKRTPRGGVTGARPEYRLPIPLELQVTKGEYVCGNKICKMEPGVVPKGCNGMCQYPILPYRPIQ